MQAGVAEQLMVMLESSSPEVRAVACACLGDLAAAHPPLQSYLSQVPSSPIHNEVSVLWCHPFAQACPDVVPLVESNS